MTNNVGGKARHVCTSPALTLSIYNQLKLMKFKLLPLAALLIFAVAQPLRAQLTATQAFVSAPHTVLPMLDNNTRLDMLDYHSSGMDVKSTNALRGKSALKSVSPEAVDIEMTEVSDYTIAILPPKSGSDTLVAVIATMATPVPDSRLAVYSSDWEQTVTDDVFSPPTLRDWLTDAGRSRTADVEAAVPFMLVAYAYNPATRTLTLSDNTVQNLSSDVRADLDGCLKPQLQYQWNGHKFELRR